MSSRYQLNIRAMPAGILLLLAAASMFLQNITIPGLTDRVAYGICGLLVSVSILLFTRRRNAACGVLFIILTVVAVVGIYTALTVVGVFGGSLAKTHVLLAYLYGARAICFLGLSILCLRRKKEPQSGPWLLPVVIYMIALALLSYLGIQEMEVPSGLLLRLMMTELLLFIGLVLTSSAFCYIPKDADSNASDEAATSQTQWSPPYRSVSGTFSKTAEEDPGQENNKDSITHTIPSPASTTDSLNSEPKNADETDQVEIAQFEWLDE